MGVDGLSKLLKKYDYQGSPVNITDYAGTKIAIDIYGVFYRFLAVINKEISEKGLSDEVADETLTKKWTDAIINWLMTNFIRHGITPVICLDGAPSAAKGKCLEDRARVKHETRRQIQELRTQKDTDPLSFSKEDELRLGSLRASLLELKDRVVVIEKLFRDLGLPVLKATHEGEKLGCLLAIAGKVAAVYSSDFDCFAYPCRYIIRDIQNGNFIIWDMNKVLYLLDMTHPQLQDFLIMCGCDFNNRVDGIGPVRSHALIQEFGSLDSIPEERLKGQRDKLNIEVCRQEFSNIPWKEYCMNPETSLEMSPIRETCSLNEFTLKLWNLQMSKFKKVTPKPNIIYAYPSKKQNVIFIEE